MKAIAVQELSQSLIRPFRMVSRLKRALLCHKLLPIPQGRPSVLASTKLPGRRKERMKEGMAEWMPASQAGRIFRYNAGLAFSGISSRESPAWLRYERRKNGPGGGRRIICRRFPTGERPTSRRCSSGRSARGRRGRESPTSLRNTRFFPRSGSIRRAGCRTGWRSGTRRPGCFTAPVRTSGSMVWARASTWRRSCPA